MSLNAINLGLPSGTLWADRNVGASLPEEYGSYFSWGETLAKSSYDEKNYKWGNGTADGTLIKYNTKKHSAYYDNMTILESSDDAATQNLGCNWRIPTRREFEELLMECTWTWFIQNGVNGFKITGPNGNFLFFPAAGCHYSEDMDFEGTGGRYWSSSVKQGNPNFAYNLYFYSGNYALHYLRCNYRSNGCTIRAVSCEKIKT